MDIDFVGETDAFERQLLEQDLRAYGKLWDVLDALMSDPAEAKARARNSYVSTKDLWGTKVPGTDLTIFWRTKGSVVEIHVIAHDLGV
ncbi:MULTISPECIES: hypothetical protein [unclassified Microbacterium]|uniref:hypothetical protein n=1 Tax=unclassified Microbacterium TaxID=2609290 RepID=UPI0012FA46C1|nr:hypothetical protein [Microbacterium sp. MAH-37]MVQ41403.1 hypothetical protein [Microbacterium sp. MAH-37]